MGMESSLGRIANADRRLLAPPHVPFYDDRAWRPAHGLAPATWAESTTADGSICSTAGDMAHYLRMLLNRGRGDVAQAISEASFDLLVGRAVDSPEYEDGSRYGLGVLLTEDGGERYIRHGGSCIGYTCGLRVNVDAGLGVMVLTNGQVDTADVQRFALGLVRANRDGGEPPPPPLLPDEVPGAEKYAGTYVSPAGGSIRVTASGTTLTASLHGGATVRLLRGDDDAFVPDSDDWDPFPLQFQTNGDRIAGLVHGSSVYVSEGDRPAPATAGDWSAFAGHYRTHDPWYSNFRIVDRGGALVLIWGFGEEEPLERLPDGSFRAGEDPRMPERVRFEERDDGGPVLRVNYSGLDYFRSFTP
jgi:D-alanyl-D-alanine carboxypeptidase